MDCYNCEQEEVKLNEQNVCTKCKLKLSPFCQERMFDHYEERMCEYCDEDYCQVCCQYLSEGTNGLCRSCLTIAAELYIQNQNKKA